VDYTSPMCVLEPHFIVTQIMNKSRGVPTCHLVYVWHFLRVFTFENIPYKILYTCERQGPSWEHRKLFPLEGLVVKLLDNPYSNSLYLHRPWQQFWTQISLCMLSSIGSDWKTGSQRKQWFFLEFASITISMQWWLYFSWTKCYFIYQP